MAKDKGGHGSEGRGHGSGSINERPSRWHVIDKKSGQKVQEHGPNSRGGAVREARRLDYEHKAPGRHSVVPHWGDTQRYAKGPRPKINMSDVLAKHAASKKPRNT